MSSTPAAAPGDQTALLATASRGVRVARAPRTGWLLRALLVGGVLAAIATAAGSGDPTAQLRADPSLATLLRGMAIIKALLTVAAAGALWWRFARPIAHPVAAAYLAGTWSMAAASMVVWRLSHIGVGALGFHAGELTVLFVAWLEHRREASAEWRAHPRVRSEP